VAQISLRTVILCVMARQPMVFGADPGAMADIIRRSAGFMFNVLLTRVDSSTPLWVIGRLLPAVELGLFARANSLMNYPAGVFYSVVDRVIFPAVALVQNQTERLREGALDAVRLTAIVGIPIAVALNCLGADIIRFVLGPNWEGAVAPFQVLAIAAYFKMGGRLNWIILRGMGKPYGLAAVQVVLLVATIAACVAGARWGLQGVAAAVATTICLSYLASGVLAMRVAKIPVAAWAAAHGHGLVCGALAGAILAPLAGLLREQGQPSFVILAAGGLAGVVAGGLAAWLAPKLFLGKAGMTALRAAVAVVRRKSRGASA
jgi:PST family polysaccharide transporter